MPLRHHSLLEAFVEGLFDMDECAFAIYMVGLMQPWYGLRANRSSCTNNISDWGPSQGNKPAGTSHN